VVVPTYDERENIEAFMASLLAVLATTGREHVVLVVDDSSPDGTGAVVDRLAAGEPRVRVLHRSGRRGLAQAYLAGFRMALSEGAELICEMDADFSHDPAHLPALLAAADVADLAIGSRYVDGGGVRNWGLTRKVVSRGGCLYARLMLGVDVRDLTGGFKCFRREVLESIDLDAVRSRGYAFQVELTFRALQKGFQVEEVPITFTERRAGRSKMSRRIVLEAAWMVPLLRLDGGRKRAS
jgi:dolichol-phosphate mannosyltransferase